MTPNRKLAAILAADVVGYSRLMQEDEAGTLAALKQRRKEILEPIVAQHRGRIIKAMGDGVLIEFASAVAAVQCAVELQQAMNAANYSNGANDANDKNRKTILLRIGVNLGDVVVEGSDLYGDGVNVAARLEAIAEPGTVCISAKVRDEVQGKIDVKLDDIGEVALKNMERPVHVFRVNDVGPAMHEAKKEHGQGTGAKPSIAVLPFTNMSGDPEQQYFSDGMTEDIITELSRFRSLFVIARNSSFQFRDKAVDVRYVGRELGVQYVVEGSVRKFGDRIRVTAQLIHCRTGNHLWADRFDRPLADIFLIQDELVQTLAATLEGRLSAYVAEQSSRKPTANMVAYECVLKARRHLSTYNIAVATPLLERAISLDPNYAQAYAWLGQIKFLRFFSDSRPELLDEALDDTRKAVALDESDAYCHCMLAQCHTFRREFDLANIHFSRAISLNPTDPLIIANRAHWLTRVGRHEDAVNELDLALTRDPFPPSWHWEVRAIATLALRRYEDVIEATSRMSELYAWNHAYLAAGYAHLGNTEGATAEKDQVLRMQPNFTISYFLISEPFKNAADAEPLVDGLRMAGLPE